MIDPITQYILEQDDKPDNSSFARRATLKTAKAATYVATDLKSRLTKKTKVGKCKYLELIAIKFGRRGGQCNEAKHEYYKRLLSICKNGFKLKVLVDDSLRKTFIKPSTRKQLKAESEKTRNKILADKEGLEISKKLVGEKCKAKAEKLIKKRSQAKEKRISYSKLGKKR